MRLAPLPCSQYCFHSAYTTAIQLARAHHKFTPHSPPPLQMKYYGSTILGYLAAFGLKAPTALLLAASCLDVSSFLSDDRHACKKTGFLPLHAAVANGRPEMFDFLIGRSAPLDEACHRALYARVDSPDGGGVGTGAPAATAGAEQEQGAAGATAAGRGRHFITLKAEKASAYLIRTCITSDAALSGLTPLQLAAKLGDHRSKRARDPDLEELRLVCMLPAARPAAAPCAAAAAVFFALTGPLLEPSCGKCASISSVHASSSTGGAKA